LKDLRTYVINLRESSKIEGLRQCPIFDDLSAEEMKDLGTCVTPVIFSKGTFIFKEGDPSAFFYVVYDGLVQVFKTSGSGKNVTFTIAGRGETLMASALFLDSYFVSTQAMSDVTLLRMGRKEWLVFVGRHPSVAMKIIALIAHRLNREYERVVDIVGEEVELRLVHCLSILASKFGPSLSLTRQELANFAGTTTETTIRVLSKLKKKGVISCSASRGEIVISDLATLQNYSM
jgi:CRP-like cAMP-binding protein